MTPVLDLDPVIETIKNSDSAEFELKFADSLKKLEFDTTIASKPELLDINNSKDGQLKRYGFETQSGHRYDALIGIPKNQTSDIPVIGTTAWFTTTRGHNEHATRHILRAGSPVIFVGAEGSYHSNTKNKPSTPITLTESAGAVLNFSNYIAAVHSTIMDSENRVAIGESRGAMIGMGLLALDKHFNQNVLYGDLTAPCFPKKFEIKDILKLTGHIFKEPVSMVKAAGHLTLKQVIHYPATIDLNRDALSNQLATRHAIFSGEAGQLARLIPDNKIIHITCFNSDFASMQNEWHKIFKFNPNVRITPLDGSHLTITDPETLSYLIARNITFQEAVKSNNLSPDYIFNRAHELVLSS